MYTQQKPIDNNVTILEFPIQQCYVHVLYTCITVHLYLLSGKLLMYLVCVY